MYKTIKKGTKCSVINYFVSIQISEYSYDWIYFYMILQPIKSIRNSLYNNRFIYKDNEVNFNYINDLYYMG